jgi:mannose-1-phosphate guanylyltransferase
MGRTQRRLWAVVLAGGDGRRLGLLTTDAQGVSIPKQYCSLNGGASLLQLSLRRAECLVPPEQIVAVVAEQHRQWWEPELASLPRSNVVAQPSNRGTGLGILLPLLVIAKSDPHAAVLCLPSDHYVADEVVLAASLRQAVALQSLDCSRLTVLGMLPNGPDAGYGYLTPRENSGLALRTVESFCEKPEPERAAQLIRAGGVWNSGIFTGVLRAILDLYPRHVPGLLGHLRVLVNNWMDPQVPSAELVAFYASQPTIDFSRDVLERQPERLQCLTVPSCGWNDVGTPTRLAVALSSLAALSAQHLTNASHSNAFNLAAAIEATPRIGGASLVSEHLQTYLPSA